MASNASEYNGQEAVIVIGTGPAGLRFAEELSRLLPEQEIRLFGGEPWHPYDRVKLSSLLAGEVNVEEIYSPLPVAAKIHFHHNTKITDINKVEQRVVDAAGQSYAYSRLVLATGSRPFIPSIPGTWYDRVYSFRDLKDTEKLLARSAASKHTVVIGGGLLGLETARALQRSGTKITVVQQGPHLMNRQLDATAAALLQASVEELGIQVRCGIRVKEILGEQALNGGSTMHVTGVALQTLTRDMETLGCDTVVIAAGIVPNIDLARSAGLSFGRGITVDDQLCTSDAQIHAIGECAEYRQQIYGLVAPGFEQAAIAAKVIAAKAITADGQKASYQGSSYHRSGYQGPLYKGSLNVSQLKVVGEDVFSAGEVSTEMDPSLQTISFRDRENKGYRAIFFRHNRLRGALSFGAWPGYQRVAARVADNPRLTAWRLLRFKRTGNLFTNAGSDNPATWPANAMVCNCAGVTRGQLTAACSQGCASIAALGEATRAGTLCGSCQPLLAQLVGSAATLKPVFSTRILLPLSLFLLGLLGAILAAAPVPYSTSVQVSLAWDSLWLSSTIKQITGFSLLGLSLIGLVMSLNKRIKKFPLGKFSQWRLFHSVLGGAALAVLLAHTGFNLGANLNRWLMLDFLGIILLGGLAGALVGAESKLPRRSSGALRRTFTWAHRLVFWPMPVLLAFHVLSVYYF